MGMTFHSIGYWQKSSSASLNKFIPLQGGITKLKTTYGVNNFDPGTGKKMLLSSDERYLCVLEDFDMAGSILTKNLAIWDLTKQTWMKAHTSFDSATISDIALDDQYLYVISNIQRAGAIMVNNIARYSLSNNQWYALNKGLDSAPLNIYNMNGRIIVTSVKSGIGKQFPTGMAVWDGHYWDVYNGNIPVNNSIYLVPGMPNTIETFYGGNRATEFNTIYNNNMFVNSRDNDVLTDNTILAVQISSIQSTPVDPSMSTRNSTSVNAENQVQPHWWMVIFFITTCLFMNLW